MADELLQAIENIKAGKKAEGGRALAGLVKENPDNEVAWQWLSVCVRPEEQKRHCLQQVLRINPQNEQAKKTLNTLDFKPAFENAAQPVREVYSHPYPDTSRKKCSFCGNLIDAKAVVCGYCGRDIDPKILFWQRLSLFAMGLQKISCLLIILGITLPCLVILIGTLLSNGK